jgi:exodeoxyribonuclease VII large subunit
VNNIPEYTVSQLNKSIKDLLEENYSYLKLVGEVGSITIASSGHVYFSIKENDEVISCICWKGSYENLQVQIEEGTEYSFYGRITSYSKFGRSVYQLIIDQVEYSGTGSILKLIEDRKKELSLLGLFDDDKKKKLPKYPKSIGVLTSSSGSVIHDIIHRISERFPVTQIKVFPISVQGKNSHIEIIDFLDLIENHDSKDFLKPDLIIFARGGGSLEELMPFNEPDLIKRVFKLKIPNISAIGHDTDYTLLDYVSDLRAPTPTAAAEIAVPDRKDLFFKIKSSYTLMSNILLKKIGEKKLNLEVFTNKFPNITNLINNKYQNLDYFEEKIKDSLNIILKNSKIKFFSKVEKINKRILYQRIEFLYEKINTLNKGIKIQLKNFIQSKKTLITSSNRQLALLSYKNVLRRGFSVIKYNQELIKDENQINKGETFEVEFYKSKLKAKKL